MKTRDPLEIQNDFKTKINFHREDNIHKIHNKKLRNYFHNSHRNEDERSLRIISLQHTAIKKKIFRLKFISFIHSNSNEDEMPHSKTRKE